MSEAVLTNNDVEIMSREIVYQGFFSVEKLRLRHRLFNGGWSREFTRELFVRTQTVGVLLYDPAHELVGLIEQFRVGAVGAPNGPWQMEVVAGIVDKSETSEQVVRRELFEEAGITDVALQPICEYLVSPGGTNERQELWCACTDLRGRGGRFGLADANEDIMLHVIPEQEAVAALSAGRCDNAAAVICLQWLQLNRASMRSQIVHKTV